MEDVRHLMPDILCLTTYANLTRGGYWGACGPGNLGLCPPLHLVAGWPVVGGNLPNPNQLTSRAFGLGGLGLEDGRLRVVQWFSVQTGVFLPDTPPNGLVRKRGGTPPRFRA
jgi:hypothetical protein